jgi:DHA2 family multidrug resistance protein
MNDFDRHHTHAWLILITVSLSAMSVLSHSIGMISLLLPRMMSEFAIDVQSAQWVLTSFMLTMVVIMPAVGWIGDVFGQRNLYLGSLLLFTGCTFACTLAWNYPSLIFLRVIQGIAAGCFFPLTTPFIFDSFPEGRRGFVLGVSNLTLITGSTLGSLIASTLADSFGWRWGFYYTLVLCTSALTIGYVLLRDPPRSPVGRFDFLGAVTLGTAIVSAVLLVTQQNVPLGLNTRTLTLVTLCTVSAVTFIFVELRSKSPLVDLGIYRYTTFAAGSFLGFIVPATTTAVTLLLPIFLQRLLGYSILQSAILRLPSGITTAVIGPLTGWLSDRVDPRILIGTGVIGFACMLYALSSLSMQSSGPSIAGLLVLMGIVSMCIWSPLSNTMFSALPPASVRLGAGLHALMRQLGRSVGGALVAVMFSQRLSARVARLIGGVSASSAVFSYHLDRLSTRMLSYPHPDPESLAIDFIQQTLWQEATVAAFSDCYRITAVIFLITIIPVYFLRRTAPSSAQSQAV